MGVLRGMITLLLMSSFIAMTVWVWSRRNRQRFDAAARMPLEDDHQPSNHPHPRPLPEPGEGVRKVANDETRAEAKNSLSRFRERVGVRAFARESKQ